MNNKLLLIFTALSLAIISFILVYTLENEMLKALISPISIAILGVVSLSYGQLNDQSFFKQAIPLNEIQAIHDNGIATLYIGNIPYKASEEDILKYFKEITDVFSIRLMKDKRTGKRKGFGFIEVPIENANNIIQQMNDCIFMERNLIVRPAKDKIN